MLAIPGPTKSLLFVSGVSRGFQASLKLIVAEVGAYLISLSVLISALKPVISAYPAMPQLLRVACSIALVYVAVKLWQSGGPAAPTGHPITVRRVFLTTLMNPKNLIFAFGMFPPTTHHGIQRPAPLFSRVCHRLHFRGLRVDRPPAPGPLTGCRPAAVAVGVSQ